MVTSSFAVQGQDFFNAQPGPKLTQLDNYINLDTKTNEISGKSVPKLFSQITEKSKLLLATPITLNKEGIKLDGINAGYMQQNLFGKEIYSTIALGVFKDSSGNPTQITPQAYLTLLQNNVSLNLEGAINFDTKTGKKNKKLAITAGFGNSRVRGGVSAILQDGQRPAYQLVGRVDLKANHKYWMEAYASNKQTLGLRFAANF
jgi:hypothetical protein